MKQFPSLILFLFFTYFASAQQIKPYVFNSGGGTNALAGGISAEWSIGESSTIVFFPITY